MIPDTRNQIKNFDEYCMQETKASDSEVMVHGSLHDRTTEHLRDLIVAGELESGDKLSERELMERYGFPRTPLREAFKVLATEGLVDRSPNRGAHVAKVGIKEIEQIIEVLQALEAQAARLLVERITQREIDQIVAVHTLMVEHRRAGRLMAYFNTNQDLHQLIISASGNPFLAKAYASHSARIRRFRYLGNEQTERWKSATSEHEQILDAIKERNGQLLEALLCTHLKKGWRVVKEQMLTRENQEP